MERRNPTAAFKTRLQNSWASHGQSTAGFLLIIVAGALAAGGLVATYYDLMASYYGWGKLIEMELNLPHTQYLSYMATALPTLLQMAYYYALVADHDISRHTGVKVIHWIMWGLDTLLDVYQLNKGTPRSVGVSVVVAVVLFGFVSEFLITFFGSVFIGTLWSRFASPEMWDPTTGQKQAEPHSSFGARPMRPSASRPRAGSRTRSRPHTSSRTRPSQSSGRPALFEEE